LNSFEIETTFCKKVAIIGIQKDKMQKCQLKKPISRAEKIIQCGKIGNIFFAFFCGKTCQVYDGDTYSFSDVVIWLDIRRIKIPPLTSFFPSI